MSAHNPFGHVQGHFDMATVQGALLRILRDKSLQDKYIPTLDPAYFWIGHEHPSIEAMRRIMDVMKVLQKENKSHEGIDPYTVQSRLNTQRPSEISTLSAQMFKDMVQGKAQEISTSEGCWNTFLDYLKMNELYRSGKQFESHFNAGRIEEAMKAMREAMTNIESFAGNSFDTLDPFSYEALLPEATDPKDAPLRLGHDGLDNELGGFQRQTLNLFIGRTGSGKSQMCHHIIRQCIQEKRYVHVSVVEDRKKSFTRRLYACNTGIPISRLSKEFTSLTPEEMDKLREASKLINKYVKVSFLYNVSLAVVQRNALESDADRKARGQPIYEVDIVDYTGHIAKFNPGDQDWSKMRNAFGERKDFALKHNKICFDFAQVNRGGSKSLSENKLLKIEDLAGGFDISQVCDNIVSLNRTPMDISGSTSTFLVCKGRDGITDGKHTVKVDFSKAQYLMAMPSETENPFESNVVPLNKPAEVK